VKLIDADENVSSLREAEGNSWRIPELDQTLMSLKTQVSSVGKFFKLEQSGDIRNVLVLLTRSEQFVSGYGRKYEENFPRYIVLPQMKNISQVVLQILECLENLAPELFPDRRTTNWLDGEGFLLPEEIALYEEIDQRVTEARTFVEAKQREVKDVGERNAFVRALLVAKEDPNLPLNERLSGVVKAALEYLGFQVEGIDEKIKSTIKKEDFWVTDEAFLAITEVTGTKSKNPKVKEFHDILGRMMTLYKRQSELVLPKGKNIAGLLVLNYDIETDPSKRPRAYIGADAHITETAVDQGIGILPTVELHKIVMAVKKGLLPKDAAREFLKKPGRIEYVEEERTD